MQFKSAHSQWSNLIFQIDWSDNGISDSEFNKIMSDICISTYDINQDSCTQKLEKEQNTFQGKFSINPNFLNLKVILISVVLYLNL